MQLSEQELKALHARCFRAVQKGYGIAHASRYVAALTGGSLPKGPVSAADVLAAVENAMAKGIPTQKSAAAKPKAAPKPEPKPAIPPPPPEPEPEPEVTEAGDEVPPYEEWSQEDLYAEAKAREIPNRSKMSKEELVEALLADDEAAEEG